MDSHGNNYTSLAVAPQRILLKKYASSANFGIKEAITTALVKCSSFEELPSSKLKTLS
jgi:hypothetical protein